MKFYPPRTKLALVPVQVSIRTRIEDKEAPGGHRLVLEGAEYEAQRLRVYHRDRGCCRACRRPVQIHNVRKNGVLIEKAGEVHHLRKRGMGGAYRDDRMYNLILLCWRCHNATEDGRIDPRKWAGVYVIIWVHMEWLAASREDAMEVADGG